MELTLANALKIVEGDSSEQEMAVINAALQAGKSVVVYAADFGTKYLFDEPAKELRHLLFIRELNINTIPELNNYKVNKIYLSRKVGTFSMVPRKDILLENIVFPKKLSSLKKLYYVHHRQLQFSKDDHHLDLSMLTNIEEINVSGNDIGSIKLPYESPLKEFYCSQSSLRCLKLPEGIEEVDIRGNQITELRLPSSLRRIQCDNIRFLNEVPKDCQVDIVASKEGQ